MDDEDGRRSENSEAVKSIRSSEGYWEDLEEKEKKKRFLS